MNKIFAILSLFQFFSSGLIAQNSLHPIGNNPYAAHFYDVRGIKIYTEVYGSGKPLLMIHGNGGNMNNFTGIVPYFSKKYKVILADSRSQGRTIDPADSLSFEMMADDLAALLTAMHIDSAYVLGWSDGGINALLLAMRHPKKVIKLVSSGANITHDSTAFIQSDWLESKKYYESNKNKSFTSPDEKNNWKLFKLDWLQPNIAFDDLKNISCPSLIICGDHDLITVAHTTAIYSHIPRAYLWVVPHSGHGTLVEHTEDFNKTADLFFSNPFQ